MSNINSLNYFSIRTMVAITILLCSLIITACEGENVNPTNNSSLQKKALSNMGATREVAKQLSVPEHALRSWKEIAKSGVIRASKLTWENDSSLPRSGSTAAYHQQLFEQFATLHNLQIKWILADSLAEMFGQLQNNQSDIIPRHLTRLESREQSFQFTRAVARDNEQILGPKTLTEFSIEKPYTILLPKQSSYLETVQAYDNFTITKLVQDLNYDQLIDLVLQQENTLTILDQSAVDNIIGYRNDIKVLHEFEQPTVQGWLINQKQPQLLSQLNNFIQATALQRSLGQTRTLDLNKIKSNKLPLRMITRNSPETYFMWRGELMGFEYDLMKEFAKRQGLTLQVIVADSYEDMVKLLEQGKGDVIAAGLSRTDRRKAGNTFSIRYNRVDEVLVAHEDADEITRLDDIRGREIHIRETSAFWKTGEKLRDKYGAVLVAADEFISTEMLINQVASKQIDLTIADSNLVAIERHFRDDLVTPLVLNESIPWAYMVRNTSPELLAALNAYIRKEYRQTFYNVIKSKYFTDTSRKQLYRDKRITKNSSLSPYDTIIKNQAKRHQFDWRLITAQMYQESKFDPDAKSFAGAVGLMQVLPSTAEELGYADLYEPKENIAAGVDYLNWTKQRFDVDLPLEERILFALASYNVGYGHVYDARRLAHQLGLDANVWFNNVERAILLLQKPKYYKKARFGYCRGTEPVKYVRSIHQRYLSYLEINQ